MTTEKRSYEFNNGLTITGSIEQIIEISTKIGEPIDATRLGIVPKGFYQSSTKGLVAIKDMNTVHIINALTKRTISYYENIKPKKGEELDLATYLKNYISLTDDAQVEELYTELIERQKL